MSDGWDETCDVLVVGSGAAALTGGLTAVKGGLDTMVIESTEQFGGTTAYSGGGIWIPANPVVLRAGICDSEEKGRIYLNETVGPRTSPEVRDAFLSGGPEMIAFLEADEHLEFSVLEGYPDYHPELPGGIPTGRTIAARPIGALALGDLRSRLRPPMERGMGGPSYELPPGLRPLSGGQSLLARLLLALRCAGADLRSGTALGALITDGRSQVIGADARVSGGAPRRIRAKVGVLLAAGGFERNGELRERLGNAVPRPDWTLGGPGNTGDPLVAAMAIGAATDLLDDCWWAPGFVRPGGGMSFILFERAVPGGIIVNREGRRYANESLPYNAFGHQMLRGDATGVGHIPSWFVTDQRFLDTYGFGGLVPGAAPRTDWIEKGAMCCAETVAGLARVIGVPPDNLGATVRRFNGFARTGVDADFGRGDSAYDRNVLAYFRTLPVVTDEPALPNPTLRELTSGPWYAMRIVLSDLGTKGGLVCDGGARVLDKTGLPITGLYAAGNTMASVMGHAYPGPGAAIAPAMTFGYLAARDMVRRAPERLTTLQRGPRGNGD